MSRPREWQHVWDEPTDTYERVAVIEKSAYDEQHELAWRDDQTTWKDSFENLKIHHDRLRKERDELRKEVERLKENNERLTDYYHKIRGTDKDHQTALEKRAFDLEDENRKLKATIENDITSEVEYEGQIAELRNITETFRTLLIEALANGELQGKVHWRSWCEKAQEALNGASE